jgi:hypothetical protein
MLNLDQGRLSTEVVRKRQTCVIAPFSARERVWESYCRVMRDRCA